MQVIVQLEITVDGSIQQQLLKVLLHIFMQINLQRDSNRALFSGFTVTIPIKNYIKIA